MMMMMDDTFFFGLHTICTTTGHSFVFLSTMELPLMAFTFALSYLFPPLRFSLFPFLSSSSQSIFYWSFSVSCLPLSKFHSPLHPLQYFHSSSPVFFHIFFSFSSSLPVGSFLHASLHLRGH